MKAFFLFSYTLTGCMEELREGVKGHFSGIPPFQKPIHPFPRPLLFSQDSYEIRNKRAYQKKSIFYQYKYNHNPNKKVTKCFKSEKVRVTQSFVI